MARVTQHPKEVPIQLCIWRPPGAIPHLIREIRVGALAAITTITIAIGGGQWQARVKI